MCIIIDTNALTQVFDISNALHAEFRPVYEWIVKGPGYAVYGGTKYKNELNNVRKILRVFLELKKVNKVRSLTLREDQEVDDLERELAEAIKHRDFDDPHLVAIVIVSKCKLVCTSDDRAVPFLQDKQLYPNRFTRPRIYSGRQNQNLLNTNALPKNLKKTKLNKRSSDAVAVKIQNCQKKRRR